MQNNTVTVTLSPEEQEVLEERWEKAGIGNDFIFSCVMRNQELFLKLMQRILPELKLSKVEKHATQMTGFGPAGSKSIRYDVYSEIDGHVFDVEMQLRSRGNEPRRTRYYQCLMDEQVLHAGEDYGQLPDSYIIMIALFDPFQRGRHMYLFRNFDTKDRNLELGDGTAKIFLNANGIENDILPELKNFLDLVRGKAPADDFCREVNQEVQAAKLNAETRRNFMDFEYMRMLDRIDSRKEGKEEGKLEMGADLVRDGILTLPEAAKRAGVSEDKLKKRIQNGTLEDDRSSHVSA